MTAGDIIKTACPWIELEVNSWCNILIPLDGPKAQALT